MNSARLIPKRDDSCCSLSYVSESFSVSTLASVDSGIPISSLISRKVHPRRFLTARIILPNVLLVFDI